MTPFSWFCLSLRIMGAWLIVQSLQYFVAGFDFVHGFDLNTQYKIEVYLNQGITHLATGFVLILFAPTLAALVYPRRSTHEQTMEDKA